MDGRETVRRKGGGPVKPLLPWESAGRALSRLRGILRAVEDIFPKDFYFFKAPV